MTYITEKSEFVGDDIPLLETSTPVKGYDGTDIGPANAQAQILANRTAWLKEGLADVNDVTTKLTDTTEKITLKQTAIDKRVTQVTSSLSALEEQEKNDFEYLTIGLGQATTSIAQNKQDIQNLNTRQDETASTVQTLKESVLAQGNDIAELKEEKQDALESGKNVNTVMGVSLEDVKEGGITLADAKDFVNVLQQKLSVGKGLTLDASQDGQSAMLNVVKEENLGSNLNIRVINGVKANTNYELKTKQRPNYNLRAFAFKADTVAAQPKLTVNFITDPNTSLSSPYEGSGMINRINFVPDSTTSRWSTLNTLTIDTSPYPETRLAISADNENWYSYSLDASTWVELGQLKVDTASADIVATKGITLQNFATLDKSILASWLAGQEDTPSLNLAFAASVNSADQVFVPAKMVATFNTAKTWLMQSPYFVHVSITQDSIIFQPTSSGDFVFCFEFQK